jgi:hypothetical protein
VPQRETNHYHQHTLYQKIKTVAFPMTWWKDIFECQEALHVPSIGHEHFSRAEECATYAPTFFFSIYFLYLVKYQVFPQLT